MQSRTIFSCMWPGCTRNHDSLEDIERHVRSHLGPKQCDSIGEEDFYYEETEVDEATYLAIFNQMPMSPSHNSDGLSSGQSFASSSPATSPVCSTDSSSSSSSSSSTSSSSCSTSSPTSSVRSQLYASSIDWSHFLTDHSQLLRASSAAGKWLPSGVFMNHHHTHHHPHHHHQYPHQHHHHLQATVNQQQQQQSPSVGIAGNGGYLLNSHQLAHRNNHRNSHHQNHLLHHHHHHHHQQQQQQQHHHLLNHQKSATSSALPSSPPFNSAGSRNLKRNFTHTQQLTSGSGPTCSSPKAATATARAADQQLRHSSLNATPGAKVPLAGKQAQLCPVQLAASATTKSAPADITRSPAAADTLPANKEHTGALFPQSAQLSRSQASESAQGEKQQQLLAKPPLDHTYYTCAPSLASDRKPSGITSNFLSLKRQTPDSPESLEDRDNEGEVDVVEQEEEKEKGRDDDDDDDDDVDKDEDEEDEQADRSSEDDEAIQVFRGKPSRRRGKSSLMVSSSQSSRQRQKQKQKQKQLLHSNNHLKHNLSQQFFHNKPTSSHNIATINSNSRQSNSIDSTNSSSSSISSGNSNSGSSMSSMSNNNSQSNATNHKQQLATTTTTTINSKRPIEESGLLAGAGSQRNVTANFSQASLANAAGQRRIRGENRKCRKVYGMERRDSWCTQCKWKKACSRFCDP